MKILRGNSDDRHPDLFLVAAVLLAALVGWLVFPAVAASQPYFSSPDFDVPSSDYSDESIFDFMEPQLSSFSEGSSWHVVFGRESGHVVKSLPVCSGSYSTAQQAFNCLVGKSWPAIYVNRAFNNVLFSSLSQPVHEGLAPGIYLDQDSSVDSASECQLVSGIFDVDDACYFVKGPGSSGLAGTSPLTLFDGFGRQLRDPAFSWPSALTASTLACPYRVLANWSGGSSTCQFGSLNDLGVKGGPVPLMIVRLPGPPTDPEDGECEGRTLEIVKTRAEVQAQGIVPGVEFEHGSCRWRWTPLRTALGQPVSTNACLPFLGTQPTICYADGIEPVTGAPSDGYVVSPSNPLELTVGATIAEQQKMRVPDVANALGAWGQDLGGWFGTVDFGDVGMLAALQAIYNMPLEDLELWLLAQEGDLLAAEFEYDRLLAEAELANPYYHPGNYTAGGSIAGHYDRDWGETPYDEGKAWNWGTTPAVDTPPEQLEVIAESGGETFVTNVTNITNNHYAGNVTYPPGVTPPHTNPNTPSPPVTPPPESSIPGTVPGYTEGTVGYESRYPDGLSGVWDGFKGNILSQSGVEDFVGAFTLPTMLPVPAEGLCWSINFDMGNVINLGEQGFCVPDWIVLLLRTLLFVMAGLVARRLVLGG